MKSLLQSIAVAAVSLFMSMQVHATAVALELQLMIDTSGSVDQMEFDIQRLGYAAAFSDLTVQSAIVELAMGDGGGIAVSVSYFSTTATDVPTDGGVIAPNPQIDWVQLQTTMEIDNFVMALTNLQPTDGDGDGGGTGETNIGDAILFGINSLNDNAFDGLRSVIDVSSDGIQNVTLSGDDSIVCGFPPDQCSDIVVAQRDAAAAANITVNGLAITTDEALIEDYFNAFVRTQDGFVLATEFEGNFTAAITEKITREISPIPIPAAIWLFGSALGLLALRKKQIH